MNNYTLDKQLYTQISQNYGVPKSSSHGTKKNIKHDGDDDDNYDDTGDAENVSSILSTATKAAAAAAATID